MSFFVLFSCKIRENEHSGYRKYYAHKIVLNTVTAVLVRMDFEGLKYRRTITFHSPWEHFAISYTNKENR